MHYDNITGPSDVIIPISNYAYILESSLFLEQINLHVIAATADGASPNRRFFRMHKFLQGDSEIEDVFILHRASSATYHA